MSDIGELKERAEKLARRIGLVETELRTIDIFTKVDDISNEIKRLRDSNDQLLRENDELKVSLNTLISSVEDSQLSDLSETFLGVKNKMEAILESGQIGHALTGAKTTSRLAVVADVVTTPLESPIDPSAEKEPERWNIPSGTQRTPGNTP